MTGLISYHSDHNYGTMLQAYALERALHSLGVESEYVSYHDSQSPSAAKRLLRLIRGIFHQRKEFSAARRKFDAFHKRYIPHSRQFYNDTICQADALYDNFIVGSDQVWSPFMNRRRNGVNFLRFVSENAGKNAYAPSLGKTSFSPEYLSYLKENLKDFRTLSCRERQNAEMLSDLLGRKVHYVLDPTLLLDSEEWDRIATPVKMPESYILCYALGEKKSVRLFAEKLGRHKGLPVYYILTGPSCLKEKNIIGNAGPSEFVYLVKNAACIVTDSFHGTLFSIIYRRSFYSFAKRESSSDDLADDNARIPMFLSELSLEHRFRKDDDSTFCEDIDYDIPAARLGRLKEDSMAILKEISGR